jgi:hypothetical protein
MRHGIPNALPAVSRHGNNEEVMRYGYKRPSKLRRRFELLEDRLNFSWGSTPSSTIKPPSSPVAVTLDSQRDATGTASIASTEIDWYRFTATVSGSYSLEATTPSSSLDTVLGLYKSSGKRVAYNDDISGSDNDSRVSVSLTAGKKYLLGITNYKGTPGGAYTWKIDGPAPPVVDDSYENNDSQTTAASLGTLTSTCTISGLKMADAADWFSFTTTAAGTSSNQVSISFVHSQGDLDLRLYNSSGTQIGQSEGTSNQEVVSLNGLAAGTYFVQVFGYNGAQNSSYDLAITPPSGSTPPPPSTQDAWTFFVYMTASNLQQFAHEDINEMEVAASQLPGTVNIVTLWDQSAAYTAYSTGNGNQSAWRTTGRAVITGDTNMSRVATQFEILAEQNTGNPTTLQNFLTWGATVAPAQHYGLIMWNHGAGIYGSNYDDSDNAGSDHLTISEVASALGATGVPVLDVFSYDACMMGMAEIGYVLKDRAQMFVASEELEAGAGHDYRTLFNVLRTNPTSVTSEQVANGFVTSFGAQYVGTGVNEDTHSAAKMSQYGTLATALKSFSDSTLSATSTIRTALQTARNNAVLYDGDSYVDFRDLGSFMRNVYNNTSISSTIRTAANGVLTAITNLVSSKTSDRRSSSGVSIYLPKTSVDSSYASSFATFNAATGWGSFVNWLTTGSRATPANGADMSLARGPAQRAAGGAAVNAAFAAALISESQTGAATLAVPTNVSGAATRFAVTWSIEEGADDVVPDFRAADELMRTPSTFIQTAVGRASHEAVFGNVDWNDEVLAQLAIDVCA